MLVLDFKVDYRVKNTQKYFCSRNAGNALMRILMCRRKKTNMMLSVHPGVESLLGQTAQRQVQVLWIQ